MVQPQFSCVTEKRLNLLHLGWKLIELLAPTSHDTCMCSWLALFMVSIVFSDRRWPTDSNMHRWLDPARGNWWLQPLHLPWLAISIGNWIATIDQLLICLDTNLWLLHSSQTVYNGTCSQVLTTHLRIAKTNNKTNWTWVIWVQLEIVLID